MPFGSLQAGSKSSATSSADLKPTVQFEVDRPQTVESERLAQSRLRHSRDPSFAVGHSRPAEGRPKTPQREHPEPKTTVIWPDASFVHPVRVFRRRGQTNYRAARPVATREWRPPWRSSVGNFREFPCGIRQQSRYCNFKLGSNPPCCSLSFSFAATELAADWNPSGGKFFSPNSPKIVLSVHKSPKFLRKHSTMALSAFPGAEEQNGDFSLLLAGILASVGDWKGIQTFVTASSEGAFLHSGDHNALTPPLTGGDRIDNSVYVFWMREEKSGKVACMQNLGPGSPINFKEQIDDESRVMYHKDHCTNTALVGQVVSGVLDGSFEAGYLLTVRVGETGTVLRGVVFEPGLFVPISAVNDVAPHLKMISRNAVTSPLNQVPSFEAGLPTRISQWWGGVPFITSSVVILYGLVYLVCLLFGYESFIQICFLHSAVISPFQVYRIYTSVIFHGSLLYILFTLLAFVPLGSQLERIMGSLRLLHLTAMLTTTNAILNGGPGCSSSGDDTYAVFVGTCLIAMYAKCGRLTELAYSLYSLEIATQASTSISRPSTEGRFGELDAHACSTPACSPTVVEIGESMPSFSDRTLEEVRMKVVQDNPYGFLTENGGRNSSDKEVARLALQDNDRGIMGPQLENSCLAANANSNKELIRSNVLRPKVGVLDNGVEITQGRVPLSPRSPPVPDSACGSSSVAYAKPHRPEAIVPNVTVHEVLDSSKPSKSSMLDSERQGGYVRGSIADGFNSCEPVGLVKSDIQEHQNDTSTPDTLCLYSCCSGCVPKIQVLIRDIIIDDWKSNQGGSTLEDVHECAGIIEEVGSEVKHLIPGDPVAIAPGISCWRCDLCRNGRYKLFPEMQFFATPPVHGSLANQIVHPADLCFKLPDNVSLEEGPMCERLSVGIHACRRAVVGPGTNVLIMGAGPIGLVTMLAARAFGAQIQQAMGLVIDITFDCAAFSNTMTTALNATGPGGKVCLVGMGHPELTVPLTGAAPREVDVVGIFRY